MPIDPSSQPHSSSSKGAEMIAPSSALAAASSTALWPIRCMSEWASSGVSHVHSTSGEPSTVIQRWPSLRDRCHRLPAA